MKMKYFFRKLFDSRNKEVEAHLVLLVCGVVIFIALSVYHVVVLAHAFDPSPYGLGFACLMAGGGAAAWGQGMQRKSEKGDADESGQ